MALRLGTPDCTNAILERRNLNRVGLVRIGAPATLAIPPACAFKGNVDTLADVAVAAGLTSMGDPSRLRSLEPSLVATVLARIRATCEDVIDRMKTSADPISVVLVGGGSVIVPPNLAPAAQVLRPAHHDVANAIGAAIAQWSGDVERVFSLEQHTRADGLLAHKCNANSRARRRRPRAYLRQPHGMSDPPFTCNTCPVI